MLNNNQESMKELINSAEKLPFLGHRSTEKQFVFSQFYFEISEWRILFLLQDNFTHRVTDSAWLFPSSPQRTPHLCSVSFLQTGLSVSVGGCQSVSGCLSVGDDSWSCTVTVSGGDNENNSTIISISQILLLSFIKITNENNRPTDMKCLSVVRQTWNPSIYWLSRIIWLFIVVEQNQVSWGWKLSTPLEWNCKVFFFFWSLSWPVLL